MRQQDTERDGVYQYEARSGGGQEASTAVKYPQPPRIDSVVQQHNKCLTKRKKFLYRFCSVCLASRKFLILHTLLTSPTSNHSHLLLDVKNQPALSDTLFCCLTFLNAVMTVNSSCPLLYLSITIYHTHTYIHNPAEAHLTFYCVWLKKNQSIPCLDLQ